MIKWLKPHLISILRSQTVVLLKSKMVSKEKAEADFWKGQIQACLQWFRGDGSLWGVSPPSEIQKIQLFDEKNSAILTFFELGQKAGYLEDLHLKPSSFDGCKLLDIGSGPYPSALVFSASEVFCLDPLLPTYMRLGYPTHLYDSRAKFVFGRSEALPFESGFFDAVISVNAIDHVDDFEATANEIKRVLKPGGKLRMHVHYHKRTVTEPLEINDSRFRQAFGWAENLMKIHESDRKRGHVLDSNDEKYVVWSNF